MINLKVLSRRMKGFTKIHYNYIYEICIQYVHVHCISDSTFQEDIPLTAHSKKTFIRIMDIRQLFGSVRHIITS